MNRSRSRWVWLTVGVVFVAAVAATIGGLYSMGSHEPVVQYLTIVRVRRGEVFLRDSETADWFPQGQIQDIGKVDGDLVGTCVKSVIQPEASGAGSLVVTEKSRCRS